MRGVYHVSRVILHGSARTNYYSSMMSEPPFLCINETTLFFHNRRFDTPLAKKNTTRLVLWANEVPPPGPVLRLENKLKTSTASQHSAGTSVPSTLNHSSKSSRARVVTTPTTTALGTKRSLKRKVTECQSDIDEPMTADGGLQDEDNALDELATVASPMKARAAEKNKANVMFAVSRFIPPHRGTTVHHRLISKLSADFQLKSNPGIPEGDSVPRAFQRVRVMAEDGL